MRSGGSAGCPAAGTWYRARLRAREGMRPVRCLPADVQVFPQSGIRAVSRHGSLGGPYTRKRKTLLHGGYNRDESDTCRITSPSRERWRGLVGNPALQPGALSPKGHPPIRSSSANRSRCPRARYHRRGSVRSRPGRRSCRNCTLRFVRRWSASCRRGRPPRQTRQSSPVRTGS